MAFNPLKEKGTPVEKQVRSWDRLYLAPYDKNAIHPYSRARIILMNGVEVEGAMFSHNFARHATDPSLQRKLAMTRRIEQQQQKMINWLPPAEESVLEVTIGYEQLAVDLTAALAKSEPDPTVKAALDFALLEDFDHLYRYANLMEMTEGKEAEKNVQDLTEITVGRPTKLHHRHPFDSVRRHYDKTNADIRTMLNVLTITSGEQQTMNLYMNVGNRAETTVGRQLYQEIGMVEEQHVSQYESLMDPSETWFEQLMMHEYHECYLYWSFMMSEPDQRLKKFWEENLSYELEHLAMACDLFRQYENREPESMLPQPGFPEPLVFNSAKEYVRKVLADQLYMTADLTEIVPLEQAPDRFTEYQELANGGTVIPSEKVISDHREKYGREYRLETEGPHPIEALRA